MRFRSGESADQQAAVVLVACLRRAVAARGAAITMPWLCSMIRADREPGNVLYFASVWNA